MGGVIQATNLGKVYRRYHSDRPATFQEAFLAGMRKRRPVEEFWALRKVNVEIESGKTVGVLGANGAGKSTLLRLIGGVGRPDEGSVRSHGRIGALLDLGAGFHPDLTGHENVYINGIISGLTRRQVAQRFDEIVDFAELEDFIDSPLRTYSSGMQMRLGFAIASNTDPEILLIDEVLAVGDIKFQQKCADRIDRFKQSGCTILLVSHDPELVGRLCDEAVWLRAGRVVSYGPASIVADQYLGERKSETERRTPRSWPALKTPYGTELLINQNRVGSMEMEIVHVRLLSLDGELLTDLPSGSPLQVEIQYTCPAGLEPPILGVTLTTEDDEVIFETSTNLDGISLPTDPGSGRVVLEFERLDLMGDTYYFDIGLYRSDWSYAYDYHWHGYPLKIVAPAKNKGTFLPPHRWSVIPLKRGD